MTRVSLLVGVLAAAAAAAALPRPQGDVTVVSAQDEPTDAQRGTVFIRPPRIEKVTHITAPNQYQKLYQASGKYKFGLDDDNQFRVEERLTDGRLRGIYGYKNDNGSITAYMYTYDGEEYEQVPYTVEQIPNDLRVLPEAQGLPRFV